MNSSQEALSIFQSFLGNWKGVGHSLGSETHGTLSIEHRCLSSFICFSERLFLPSGELDYEDSAWVHWETSSKQLIVHHFSPEGSSQRLLMLADEQGFHWWGGPLVPTVYYRIEKSILFVDVKQDADLVHHMRYHRI